MNENLHITDTRKQPKALLPLCATEMWERYGFYIVQGMLILLLTNHFGIDDKTAIMITGEYGALVYISPLIGGYFADKYLGFRYTILLGACFQCFGYALISTLHQGSMYWGLASVILGNGFLKPNIAGYLGDFYNDNDPRRHAGFTYYYTIMNLGTFISTLSVGFIQRSWGWHVCFGLAAVGMIIAIAAFLLGMKRYGNKGLPVANTLISKHRIRFTFLTLVACTLIMTAAYELLRHAEIGKFVLFLIAGLTLLYLLYLVAKTKQIEKNKLIALIILIIFAVIFWAIFFEMFSVVNLFIERNVNRTSFLGIHNVPPVMFMSFEPIFILLLGWPLGLLWKYLHKHKKDPNIALKFVLALACLAVGMKLLNFSIHDHTAQMLVLPGWIVIFFLLLTMGEMLLSPNLLSAVTELSPPKLVGLMMGVQYMAIGFGSAITGVLGQIAAIPKGVTNLKFTDPIYAHAFNAYALICLISALLVLAASPLIKKLIHS